MTECHDIYNEAELAKILGCSEFTVQDKARKRELPGLKFGDGGWVFPREATLQHLNRLALARLEPTEAIPQARQAIGYILGKEPAGVSIDSMRKILDQTVGKVFTPEGRVPQNH